MNRMEMSHLENCTVDNLKSIYETTLLARLCEEQIMSEYFDDEMKTPVHLGIGAEGISAAVVAAAPQGSQYFGTYRNHALYLSVSRDTDSFFGEMYGKINGCAKGKAGSMHMSCPEHGLIATSAVVGTTIPVAVGSALASQIQGTNRLAVCFFGDGAIEEGVFYESLNFASLRKLPVLFVCEDNDLAIHAFRREREGFKSIQALVNSFDIAFADGDGTDPAEVFSKTKNVLQQMSQRNVPGFVHYKYFRSLEHVGPLEDFDKGYRPRPTTPKNEFDPIFKLERRLADAGVKAEWISGLKSTLMAQIKKSVQLAKSSPFAGPDELFTDVLNLNLGAH